MKLFFRILLSALFCAQAAAHDELQAQALSKLVSKGRQLDGAWQYPFDISSYSFKYARCQTVQDYADEAAGEDGNPLISRRLAIFRLCPSSYCKGSKQYGCDSGYGEYAVELGAYLEVMAEYNEQKKEQYCQYCEECMNGGNRRLEDAAEGEGEEGEGEEGGEEEAEDNNENNNNQNNNQNNNANNQYQNSCSECSNFYNVCEEQEQDEYNMDPEYDQFFECAQLDYQDNNGNEVQLFAGVMCGSDAYSIQIGIFYDEFCTQYAGNNYNLNSITGQNFSSSGLSEYYQNECISCKESNYDYENNANDNQDADQITQVCEGLYMDSAKCEDGVSFSNGYYSQATNDMSCTYLDNIMRGAFDWEGKVFLSQGEYNKQEGFHQKPEAKVTGGQKFWLVVFILGTVGLAGYAAQLHSAVVKGPGAESLYKGGQIA